MEFSCLQCDDKYTLDDSPSELYCSEECHDEWIDEASEQVCSNDHELDKEAIAARKRAEQSGEAPVFSTWIMGDQYHATPPGESRQAEPLRQGMEEAAEAFAQGFAGIGTRMHELSEALDMVSVSLDWSSLTLPSAPLNAMRNIWIDSIDISDAFTNRMPADDYLASWRSMPQTQTFYIRSSETPTYVSADLTPRSTGGGMVVLDGDELYGRWEITLTRYDERVRVDDDQQEDT